MKFNKLIASLEESDGVAREVDVNTAHASATNDHPAAPAAEADSKGEAATAADTVTAGDSDGVTPTLQDAIDKGVQVGEDVTKMVAAQEALHTHIAAVEAFVEQNESVPTHLAKAIQVSLNRHDPNFFKRTVPSLESFDAPIGRMTVSLELLDKLKEGAKNVSAGIAAAFKKLIEAIQSAINRMVTDFSKLNARLDKAEKAIKAGDIKTGEPLNYGGLRSLTANGDIVGSSAESVNLLNTASNATLIEWPGRVLQLVKGMADKGKNLDLKDTDAAEAFIKASFTTLGASFQGAFQGIDVVKKQANEEHILETGELPGGRKVVLTYNMDVLRDGMAMVQNAARGISVKLERVEGAESPSEVKVPSKEEVLAGIKVARQLLDIGQRRRDLAGDFNSFNMDVIRSGNPVGNILISFATAGMGVNMSYTGYLNTTCKALVGYYEKISGTTPQSSEKE